MNFGEKLQLLRKQNGMSQEQLALKLNVSRQAISKWELNSCLPDTENVIQLSELFSVSLDYLLKDHKIPMNKDEKPNIDQIYNNGNTFDTLNFQNDNYARFESREIKNMCNLTDMKETTKTPLKFKKTKSIPICGIVCVSLSSISFFVIWLLSKLYPAPIVFYNSTTKTWKVGLDNFIWVHGLETFMSLIITLFIIGLLLVFHVQLRNISSSFIRKIRKGNI